MFLREQVPGSDLFPGSDPSSPRTAVSVLKSLNAPSPATTGNRLVRWTHTSECGGISTANFRQPTSFFNIKTHRWQCKVLQTGEHATLRTHKTVVVHSVRETTLRSVSADVALWRAHMRYSGVLLVV